MDDATSSSVFAVEAPYRQILEKVLVYVQKTHLWEQVKGSCFVMNGFICEVFQSLGHCARFIPCTGLAIQEERLFKLGFQGVKMKETELDGHVLALIDERVIVDFGLMNVRRYGFADFPLALALDLKQDPAFPVTLQINDREQFVWDIAAANQVVDQVMQDHAPFSKELFRQYQAII